MMTNDANNNTNMMYELGADKLAYISRANSLAYLPIMSAGPMKKKSRTDTNI